MTDENTSDTTTSQWDTVRDVAQMLLRGFKRMYHTPNYASLGDDEWEKLVRAARQSYGLRKDDPIPSRAQMQSLCAGEREIATTWAEGGPSRLATLAQCCIQVGRGTPDFLRDDQSFRYLMKKVCSVFRCAPKLLPSHRGSVALLRKRSNRKIPIVMVANHQSVVDGFAIGAVTGQGSVLAGTKSFQIPGVKELLRAINAIEVDEKARKNPQKLREKLQVGLSQGNRYLVFPESTFQGGNQVCRFATGPFTHKAIYVPISLRVPRTLRVNPGTQAFTIQAAMSQAAANTNFGVRLLAPVDNRGGDTEARAIRDTCQLRIATDLGVPIRNELHHRTFRPIAVAYQETHKV